MSRKDQGDPLVTVAKKVAKLLPGWEYDHCRHPYAFYKSTNPVSQGEEILELHYNILWALVKTVDRLDNLQDTIKKLRIW